jgi:nitroreductase
VTFKTDVTKERKNLRTLLRQRRNVYSFLDKPVPDETLRVILENATHVPSAGFTQDFDFVVIKDGATKRQLAEAANESEYVRAGHASGDFISNAPVIVVPCASKPKFEAKYGAPAEKNARLPWWLIDAGFASFALILSAFEEGFAASFIGAIDDEKVTKALSLPPDNSVVPLAIVPMGYEAPVEPEQEANRKDAIRKRRRKSDDFVHWNRW